MGDVQRDQVRSRASHSAKVALGLADAVSRAVLRGFMCVVGGGVMVGWVHVGCDLMFSACACALCATAGTRLTTQDNGYGGEDADRHDDGRRRREGGETDGGVDERRGGGRDDGDSFYRNDRSPRDARGGSSRDAGSGKNSKLFVGGLWFQTTEDTVCLCVCMCVDSSTWGFHPDDMSLCVWVVATVQVRDYFSRFGKVIDVILPKDRFSVRWHLGVVYTHEE